MKRIAILGAGGFARELAWLIDEISAATAGPAFTYEVAGFLVSDTSRLGPLDSEVLGDLSWLDSNYVDALAMGIGTPGARVKLSEEIKARFPQIPWPALVHPSVRWQKKTMQVGEGAIVCAGVIATVHIRLEPFCMVNLSCTIGHEAVIGYGSVLNPTVNISGGVELGRGVLVGTGAQILQYLKVGDRAQVGAGAVVNKDVAAGATVVGIPAKELVKKPEAPSMELAAPSAA